MAEAGSSSAFGEGLSATADVYSVTPLHLHDPRRVPALRGSPSRCAAILRLRWPSTAPETRPSIRTPSRPGADERVHLYCLSARAAEPLDLGACSSRVHLRPTSFACWRSRRLVRTGALSASSDQLAGARSPGADPAVRCTRRVHDGHLSPSTPRITDRVDVECAAELVDAAAASAGCPPLPYLMPGSEAGPPQRRSSPPGLVSPHSHRKNVNVWGSRMAIDSSTVYGPARMVQLRSRSGAGSASQATIESMLMHPAWRPRCTCRRSPTPARPRVLYPGHSPLPCSIEAVSRARHACVLVAHRYYCGVTIIHRTPPRRVPALSRPRLRAPPSTWVRGFSRGNTRPLQRTELHHQPVYPQLPQHYPAGLGRPVSQRGVEKHRRPAHSAVLRRADYSTRRPGALGEDPTTYDDLREPSARPHRGPTYSRAAEHGMCVPVRRTRQSLNPPPRSTSTASGFSLASWVAVLAETCVRPATTSHARRWSARMSLQWCRCRKRRRIIGDYASVRVERARARPIRELDGSAEKAGKRRPFSDARSPSSASGRRPHPASCCQRATCVTLFEA